MQFTLNISNKKLLKRILAISLPVLVVGASITTYLVKTNNNDTPVINNITVTNGVKRQVYLINKNNLLTPLTVVIEKKDEEYNIEDITENIPEEIVTDKKKDNDNDEGMSMSQSETFGYDSSVKQQDMKNFDYAEDVENPK